MARFSGLALCALLMESIGWWGPAGLHAAENSPAAPAPDNVWIADHQPVFSWVIVPGASQYEIWVDGARMAAGLLQTSLVAPHALTAGLHSWVVKADGPKSTVIVSEPHYFHVGTPPGHAWEFTDGFERGDLNDYRSSGIELTTNALTGKYSAASKADGMGAMHYAYNPAFSNEKEAESSLLFVLDDAQANVGVGFSDEQGVRCYAILDRAQNRLRIERRARYSIFPHTEQGFAKKSWTEHEEDGFYTWCADSAAFTALAQGAAYRLRFDLSNRQPSMGKAAMAVLESADGKVLCSVKTFLDDVNTPHPLFLIANGAARVDNFKFQLLDRWSYNWKPIQKPLNPDFKGFNPVVWRDKGGKWYMWARVDNRIRWSADGVNWSQETVAAPPVAAWDPAIVGITGDPWHEGRTYLTSPGGNYNPVQIYYSTDLMSGMWTKYSEHPGLRGTGREHVILDSQDWPGLQPFVYNGMPYRFLHITEGDTGKGGSTMMRLSNDLKAFQEIEGKDLYTNATNKPLLDQNLWESECLNQATSCAAALDGDIHVMTFKDGVRYERAIPQEAILDGKEPWKVKALQTIPGFPYYWGERHQPRDKNGASWYGGFCQWPSCYVWVKEENKLYCYWGEENTICLSVASVVPEFCCASLSADVAAVKPGSPVHVQANIWNAGNAAGVHDVDLYLDGSKVASKQLSLTAGADAAQSFDVASPSPGTHVVSVEGKTVAFVVSDPQ